MNFSTQDIWLAAWLQICGGVVSEVIMHGRTAEFVFRGVNEADVFAYRAGQAMVEPSAYSYKVRALKGLIGECKFRK